MSANEVSLHADVLRLREENDLLREELAALLTEAHDLLDVVKPNLLALYQTKIGAWELKLLKLQFQAALRKRRIELIRACLNRGQRPAMLAIEGQLELEFLQWQIRLQEAADKITAAEDRLKHLLSPMEDRELKKIYYGLAKKLHPDVNANLGDDQKRLWTRVQDAYERSDLEELRALALLAESKGPVAAPTMSLEKLQCDQQQLQFQIEKMLKEIEQIESIPPFTLRNNLSDEQWIESRRADLEKQCADMEARIADIDAHEKLLIKEAYYGQTFDQN